MLFPSRLKVVLLLGLLLASARQAFPACATDRLLELIGTTRYENLFDVMTPVLDVSSKVREKSSQGLKLFPLSSVFKGENEVFLGFGKPNVYLVVPDGKGGYQKFAGKSLKRAPSTVEDTRGWAQSGVLVRFRDVPEETIEKLRVAMREYDGEKFWTCVNANCRVLHDAGFGNAGKPLEERYFPVSLLRSIIKDGLALDGKAVEYDLIRTTPLDLQTYNMQVLKAEASAISRHGKKAMDAFLHKHNLTTLWALPKNAKDRTLAFFLGAREKAKDPLPLAKEEIAKLPGEQTYLKDLDLQISQPSQLGVLLRTIWGPHSLYEVRQARVDIDKFLPTTLKAFPQENPGFVTKLKKNVLFSEPVVARVRAHLNANRYLAGPQSEKQIFDMMKVNSEAKPNVYNIVMTKDRITLGRIHVRHPFVDWILSKHVLMSGYDPQVRFAGEVWKSADGTIHLSRNSGTYRPTEAQLDQALAYLKEVFPNVPIVKE